MGTAAAGIAAAAAAAGDDADAEVDDPRCVCMWDHVQWRQHGDIMRMTAVTCMGTWWRNLNLKLLSISYLLPFILKVLI